MAAILPIVGLCKFIYKKDPNKEPKGLLTKLFIFGFFSAIPVVIVEVLLGKLFPTSYASSFFEMFINVFIGVALVEEGFKWLISLLCGVFNKEFDEIYDIIVYTVFVSLGFACIENILYVMSYGLLNALVRAITSIPGHTCFAVIMGYFFAKAKLNEINSNDSLKVRNMVLSIIGPTIAHTLYDAFIFYEVCSEKIIYLGYFIISYIVMVVICFIIVNKISKMQVNLNTSVQTGVIKLDEMGYVVPQTQTQINSVPVMTSSTPVNNNSNVNSQTPNFCPVCGSAAGGYNYCTSCGYKLK